MFVVVMRMSIFGAAHADVSAASSVLFSSDSKYRDRDLHKLGKQVINGKLNAKKIGKSVYDDDDDDVKDEKKRKTDRRRLKKSIYALEKNEKKDKMRTKIQTRDVASDGNDSDMKKSKRANKKLEASDKYDDDGVHSSDSDSDSGSDSDSDFEKDGDDSIDDEDLDNAIDGEELSDEGQNGHPPTPTPTPAPTRLSAAELREKLRRTIFVGNLPSQVNRRKLKQLFEKMTNGKVESMRIRSVKLVVEEKVRGQSDDKPSTSATDRKSRSPTLFKSSPSIRKAAAITGKGVAVEGSRYTGVSQSIPCSLML